MHRRFFCACCASMGATMLARRAFSDGESAAFCSSMYAPASDGQPLERFDFSAFESTDLMKVFAQASEMVPAGIATRLSMEDPIQSAAFHSDQSMIVLGLKDLANLDLMRMAVLIYLHEIGHALQFTRAKSQVKLLEYRQRGAEMEKKIEVHADYLSGFLLFHLTKNPDAGQPGSGEGREVFRNSHSFGQNVFIENYVPPTGIQKQRLFPPAPDLQSGVGAFDGDFLSYRFIGGRRGRGNSHPTQAERMGYVKGGFEAAFYGVGGASFFDQMASEVGILEGLA